MKFKEININVPFEVKVKKDGHIYKSSMKDVFLSVSNQKNVVVNLKDKLKRDFLFTLDDRPDSKTLSYEQTEDENAKGLDVYTEYKVMKDCRGRLDFKSIYHSEETIR